MRISCKGAVGIVRLPAGLWHNQALPHHDCLRGDDDGGDGDDDDGNVVNVESSLSSWAGHAGWDGDGLWVCDGDGKQ